MFQVINGRYQIMGEIARGAFGAVLQGRDLQTQQPVAIKRPLGQLVGEELQRFLREARIAVTLEHPHIVRLLDAGADEQGPYQVLQHVDGMSLKERLRTGPVSSAEAARIGAQLADALEHAHVRGVLHRDLKPANVLLDHEGQAYLTDFGLAKQAQDHSLTNTGEVVGTPMYMAPEQTRGEAHRFGPGIDLYALGATLYHLVTGEPPFFTHDLQTLWSRICNEAPLPPSRRAKVDPALEQAILRCLAKEPEERFTSGRELARALQAIGAPAPAAAAPATRGEPPLRAIALGAVALVLVLGVALAFAVGGGGADSAADEPAVGVAPAPEAPSETAGGLAPGELELNTAREFLADRETGEAEVWLDGSILAGERSGAAHLERAVLRHARGALAEAFADYTEARRLGRGAEVDAALSTTVSDPTTRRLLWVTFGEEGGLDEGALLISKLVADPGLDVGSYLERLDEVAAALEAELGDGARGVRLQRLAQLCHERVAFGGKDLFNPLNSRLDQVIERGEGLQITASLVLIGLGRRVGLELEGVCYPAHFLTHLDGEPDYFVDMQQGKVIAGPTMRDTPQVQHERLVPARRQLVLVRLLMNLGNACRRSGDAEGYRRAYELIDLLAPVDTQQVKENAYGRG